MKHILLIFGVLLTDSFGVSIITKIFRRSTPKIDGITNVRKSKVERITRISTPTIKGK